MPPCAAKDMYLTDERYLKLLRRIRATIAGGLEHRAVNSDAQGDNYNNCTWGLCSDEAQHWPDAEDHLWPDLFTKHGRMSPKYLLPHQFCPLDKRFTDPAPEGQGVIQGCFWSCSVFRNRRATMLGRDEVLKRYDQAIERISASMEAQASKEYP